MLPGEKPRGRPDGLAPACGGEGCVSSELAVAAVERVSVRAYTVCCESGTLCACATGHGHGPALALGHTASPPQAHTDSLNTLVALHQLYQYTQKYYDEVRGVPRGGGAWAPLPGLPSDVTRTQIISALEEDPAAQKMQLAFRLQQIAAALENKVTDL